VHADPRGRLERALAGGEVLDRDGDAQLGERGSGEQRGEREAGAIRSNGGASA
jgi:hypothetical protein